MSGTLPHSALDRPIAVTFFKNYAATEKREEPYTPRALAERIRAITKARKQDLPWLKLATFGDTRTDKNCLRNDQNVQVITGIEADYDGETVSFEEAEERLTKAGVAAILYTSPAHTEDAPRWRVLCPLSAEMPPDQRRQMLGRLNGLFRGVFSRESWALSQSYYYGSVNHNPSHQVALVDGLPIDQHDDLDEIWLGPSATQSSPDQATQGDEREIAELVRRILTGEELHTTLCPLAARMIGRNVPAGIVGEILRGIMLAWPETARGERWRLRFGEIDRLVHSAVRKYGEDAAIRRDNDKQLAALAMRLFRQRRPSLEVCDTVRARADAMGIAPRRAESILTWAAGTELSRRSGTHA